jgi:hypothetical protein
MKSNSDIDQLIPDFKSASKFEELVNQFLKMTQLLFLCLQKK